MTVDAKLTALLVFILLMVAAPVAAHHKGSHGEGATDERAQEDTDGQDRGPDGSQGQARGPPAHAQGAQHAQTSLPGQQPDTEEGGQAEADASGSTDDSPDPQEEQASEDGPATDRSTQDADDDAASQEDPTSTQDDGTTAHDEETLTQEDDTATQEDDAGEDGDVEEVGAPGAPEEELEPSVDAQDADQAFGQDTSQAPLDPAPDGTSGSPPASGADKTDGVLADEPAAQATEDQAGSQAAFTGRLSPTTGQPLASNGLKEDQASLGQGPGVQAPVSQAPGWDLAPLILIGLAALTGGGMATLRRRGSSPGQVQTSSAPGSAPAGATEPAEAAATSPPDPGPSLPPGAPALLELAQEAVRREDHQGAIGWFEAAIALQPDLSVAHLCLGICLAGLGRDEEALESLRHAAQLAPGDPVPVYHQARLLARMGRSQDALEQLARVVPVLPGEMVDSLVEDEAFSSLTDHPRFLALTGRL